MRKIRPFRYWFYFRQGWATYFAFVFAAINTMTVTYYLVIKDAPVLKQIFPSFVEYILFMAMIGIPLLIGIGYVHYKRSKAFHAEADITTESNPYFYKLPPGYWRETLAPTYLVMTILLVKLLQNEKLTNLEIKEIEKLQKQFDVLIKGGFVGSSTFSSKSDDAVTENKT